MTVDNTFTSRWGIPTLDDYRWLCVPGFIMRNWSNYVSIQEWTFILQIMSFKFDSPNGQASPSLETIRDELGYKQIKSVQNIKNALVKKGLLKVTERLGITSIYDFAEFAKKCYENTIKEGTYPNTGVYPNTGGGCISIQGRGCIRVHPKI